MDEDVYYRAEAERCWQLAATAPDRMTARRWHELADAYATLAEEKAAAQAGRVPILSAARRRQPAQQQQSRAAEVARRRISEA